MTASGASFVLTFDNIPSLLPVYLRAPFKKNTLRDGNNLPEMTARWRNFRFDGGHVERYRRCCDLPDRPAIPWTYPYLPVARLQLRMFTHPAFPLTPMGALHARNTIFGFEAVQADAAGDIETGFLPARRVKQGLELRMYGRFNQNGRTVWACESAYLIRSKRLAGTDETPPEFRFDPVTETEGEASWIVPAGTGRAYARISGDWNPIHLGNLTARLFGGFPRALIHGMWSLARCAAVLPPDVFTPPFRFDAAFKGPVFMPGSCRLVFHRQASDGCRADLYTHGNPKPVLQARVTPCPPGG